VRAWSHSRFTFPVGERGRYPLGKYALRRERVVADGVLSAAQIAEPAAVG